MKYPEYFERSRDTMLQSVFGGYNRSAEAGEGEFFDTFNMGSAMYPCLYPRLPRGERLPIDIGSSYVVNGAFTTWSGGKEYLFVILEGNNYIRQDFVRIIDLESGSLTYQAAMDTSKIGERQFARMGAFTVMFPDKKIVRITDTGTPKFETLENETVVTEDVPDGFGNIGYYMCNLEALRHGDDDFFADDAVWRSEELPTNPANGQVWLDRGTKQNDPYGTYVGSPMMYSALNKTWLDLYPTYVKLSYPGIGKGFAEGDVVTISTPSLAGPVRSLDGNKKIEACGDDYIVVQGIVDYSEVNPGGILVPQHVGITVKRTVPDLDFVTEAGNRLWGCRNAEADGKWINEIYVSALGDPKNFNIFEGIASDAYAVTVGAQGPFTGAVTYMDVPHFFKERCAVKVYGTAPSNFETVTVELDGVEKGSHKSIAVVDGVLYYKARRGIMAYGGSAPALVSRELGEGKYTNAVGGGLNGRYYVCLAGEDGHELFAYDALRGLWHKEDKSEVGVFCRSDNRLYSVGIGGIKTMADGTSERFKWYAESTYIGLDDPDSKYISRLRIRADIPDGAFLEVSFAIGRDAPFMAYDRFTGGELDTRLVVPVPERCDHLRLKLSGEGYVRIYSIAYDYERGSDV